MAAAAPEPDPELVERARLDFLCRYLADQAAGRSRPLADYLRGQEPFAAAIAAEWRQQQAAGGAVPATEVGAAGAADPGRGIGVPAHYRIERELGRGGQGVVYLAHDTRLQRAVALKVLPFGGALATARGLRFQREALAVGRLDHPSLCAVYDVGSDAGSAWLAMKFVDGPSLQQQLADAAARRALPRTRAEFAAIARTVEQLAAGLQQAHERGLVHRDIKPGNVLLGSDGVPVLVDFGLVRGESEEAAVTLPGAVPGTPSYMAPELLRGAPAAVASDVWSLGAVLFEMLTLRRPFVAPTVAAELRLRETDGVPDVRRVHPAVPVDLAAIVATALAEEPARRYRSAGELAADLQRFRELRPVAARHPSPWQVARRWLVRNPALAASLAALVLVLAAGLGTALLLLGETRVALADVLRLSDQRRSSDLLARALTLWPLREERLHGPDGIDAWLAEAGQVLQRRPQHELAAQRLAAGDQGDEAVVWQLEQVQNLLAELDQLAAAKAQMVTRREFAATVAHRTIVELAALWSATASAVRRSPHYGGLDLLPQLGLVPLGPDPASGLFEFAHLQSGTVPERDPATGRLRCDDQTAIVLVLVPGGRYRIGCEAQPRADGQPERLDPAAEPNDGPSHELELAPFFLGKFEITQAQWRRHCGANPSNYTTQSEQVGPQITEQNPVEQVPWRQAERVLRELDLVLPTEAQWEVAYRAGTATPFPYGEGIRSLQGHENLADVAAHAQSREARWPFVLELDDGHALHAPVGSFAPNAWGFHDLGGNVREWCADSWENYGDVAPRAGDGLRFGAYDKYRIVRGGCYSSDASPARSGARTGLPLSMASAVLGVRAARPLRR